MQYVAIREDGQVAATMDLLEDSPWEVPEGWSVIQSDFQFEHDCWDYVYENETFRYIQPPQKLPEITIEDISDAMVEIAEMTALLQDAVIELAALVGGEKNG